MKEHNMEYNSQKDYLEIPEYGRNIQMLIKHAVTIEDPEYRQAFIEEIVELMLQMSPHNRNYDEQRMKLWQHVFRITDYKIDVMPPNGEKPEPSNRYKKPEKVNYSAITATYRHYGHNVQKLIKKALELEDGPKRDGFVSVIGSYMKLAYKTWIKEHYVSDDIIKTDLEKLSGGKLKIPDGVFLDNLVPAKRHKKRSSSGSSSSSRGKNNKGHQKRSFKKKYKN
jgi:hypothetical protein